MANNTVRTNAGGGGSKSDERLEGLEKSTKVIPVYLSEKWWFSDSSTETQAAIYYPPDIAHVPRGALIGVNAQGDGKVGNTKETSVPMQVGTTLTVRTNATLIPTTKLPGPIVFACFCPGVATGIVVYVTKASTTATTSGVYCAKSFSMPNITSGDYANFVTSTIVSEAFVEFGEEVTLCTSGPGIYYTGFRTTWAVLWGYDVTTKKIRAVVVGLLYGDRLYGVYVGTSHLEPGCPLNGAGKALGDSSLSAISTFLAVWDLELDKTTGLSVSGMSANCLLIAKSTSSYGFYDFQSNSSMTFPTTVYAIGVHMSIALSNPTAPVWGVSSLTDLVPLIFPRLTDAGSSACLPERMFVFQEAYATYFWAICPLGDRGGNSSLQSVRLNWSVPASNGTYSLRLTPAVPSAGSFKILQTAAAAKGRVTRAFCDYPWTDTGINSRGQRWGLATSFVSSGGSCFRIRGPLYVSNVDVEEVDYKIIIGSTPWALNTQLIPRLNQRNWIGPLVSAQRGSTWWESTRSPMYATFLYSSWSYKGYGSSTDNVLHSWMGPYLQGSSTVTSSPQPIIGGAKPSKAINVAAQPFYTVYMFPLVLGSNDDVTPDSPKFGPPSTYLVLRINQTSDPWNAFQIALGGFTVAYLSGGSDYDGNFSTQYSNNYRTIAGFVEQMCGTKYPSTIWARVPLQANTDFYLT